MSYDWREYALKLEDMLIHAQDVVRGENELLDEPRLRELVHEIDDVLDPTRPSKSPAP